MGERARIATYFAPLAAGEPGSFRLTDDAAVLTPPVGQQLVITTDSVIEGIHVLPGASPQQFGQKLVRRNLSDLAAMGATPWRYTLNLHTPRGLSDDWFALFAAQLHHEQQHFGMILTGGDSTAGATAIHLTMTCLGLIDAAPLQRHSATIGDDIYVSGTVGGASLALELLQHHQPVSAELAAHYHCPEPRLALGAMLRNIATSAIDLSDGLLADMAQLCAASGCAARILRDAVPLPHALIELVAGDTGAWRFALSGGDDYELLFTARPEHSDRIAAIASALNIPLTRIGSIEAGSGVHLHDTHGTPLPIARMGWEHP